MITERHWRFVEYYLEQGCKSAAEAARRAGFDPVNATRFLRWPEIKQKIVEHRERMTEKTVYTTEIAFRQSQELLAIAIKRKQMIAAAKFYELGLRLHGMLIDRVDMRVKAPDLVAALAMREASPHNPELESAVMNMLSDFHQKRNALALALPPPQTQQENPFNE